MRPPTPADFLAIVGDEVDQLPSILVPGGSRADLARLLELLASLGYRIESIEGPPGPFDLSSYEGWEMIRAAGAHLELHLSGGEPSLDISLSAAELLTAEGFSDAMSLMSRLSETFDRAVVLVGEGDLDAANPVYAATPPDHVARLASRESDVPGFVTRSGPLQFGGRGTSRFRGRGKGVRRGSHVNAAPGLLPGEPRRAIRVFHDYALWPLWENTTRWRGAGYTTSPEDYELSPELTTLIRRWDDFWYAHFHYDRGWDSAESHRMWAAMKDEVLVGLRAEVGEWADVLDEA